MGFLDPEKTKRRTCKIMNRIIFHEGGGPHRNSNRQLNIFLSFSYWGLGRLHVSK